MRWNFWTSSLAALAMLVPDAYAADSVVYKDAETGFTFSEYAALYQIGKSMTFRIAVPTAVSAGTRYDVVLQIAAPIDVGWAGLAWGGSMVSNPLAVAWENGNSAIISSRFATGHSTPVAYTGASYTTLKTGTHTNGTHWQVTAKCSGCTSFTGSSGTKTTLSPTGTNHLAFAYASTKPNSPSSNTSSFGVHDVTNYWYHDFSSGGNANFATLVSKNL